MRNFVLNSYAKLRQRFDKRRFSYYTSIDFLPVANFFWVIEHEDARYLLKLKDYEKLPTCFIDLADTWEKIMQQYYEEEGSNAITIYFNNYKALHRLEIQYQMFWNIYTVLSIDPENKEHLEIARQHGVSDLKGVEKKLKAIHNKIEIKQKEIEAFDVQEQKYNFMEILDIIEDAKGRSLNIYNTTVKKWIAIKKNLIKKQKQQKKAQAHGQRSYKS